MPDILQTLSGNRIIIDKPSFASGGEGDLFKIVAPSQYENQVAKIYKYEKRTTEREKKIQYLIQNSIENGEQSNNNSIVWINEILLENGKFAGIILPYAKGIKLEFLCHLSLNKNLAAEWFKFDHVNKDSLNLRLKICFNIAVALYHIHSSEKYVLVDMKPENILIQSNGLISIIDIDSIAVIENKKIVFKAPVTTPEYSPPEYYKEQFDISRLLDNSWDRFSMGVIFYRLLCGIHPYTGSCNPPYNNCNGLAEMIENGLYPNGDKRHLFKIIPKPHESYNLLSKPIKELFHKCFCIGHVNQNLRPTAEDWCVALAPPGFSVFKRPLPSQNITLLNSSFTNPLTYQPRFSIAFPDVTFFKEKKNTFSSLIRKIFKVSRGNQIIQKIRITEESIKRILDSEIEYDRKLKIIIGEFQSNQNDFLNTEKIGVNNILKANKNSIDYIDNKARIIFENERKEIEADIKILNTKINEYKNLKISIYKTSLEQVYANYKSIKRTFEYELQTENAKKEIDYKSAIDNPDKLINFSIERNFETIFGIINPDILHNLKINGFITAADILDITIDGLIKNRKRTYVKVSQIASVRAQKLKVWVDKLNFQENNKIILSIEKKYLHIESIMLKIKKLDSEYEPIIKKLEHEYLQKAANIDESIKSVEKQKIAVNEVITKKYDISFNELCSEAINVVAYGVNELKMINITTRDKINLRLSEYRTFFDELMQQKDRSFFELTLLIKTHTDLIRSLDA